MLGKIETLGTNLIGRKFPCIHHLAFSPRISWQKRVQIVWPQWLYQPLPQFWIGPSSLTGPYVRSEHCAIIWTGHQTSGRTKSWSLSPSTKVSIRTSLLPPSPLGSVLCFLWEVYFSIGTELIPLFPTSEQVCLRKKGGEQVGIFRATGF